MIDPRGTRTVHVSDSSHDFFTRNLVVVMMKHRFPAIERMLLNGEGRYEIVQTLPARKYGVWMPVHREALADHGNYVLRRLSKLMDRTLTMTTFAVAPWPAIELFPRIVKLQRLLRRVRAKLSSHTSWTP